MILNDKPWKANETNLYTIKSIENQNELVELGTLKISISEGDTNVKFITELKVNGEIAEESYLIADKDSLLPIEGQVKSKMGDIEVILNSKYSKRNILLYADTRSGKYKRKLKNKEITFDNIEFISLLRSINFLNQKIYSINIMCIQSANIEKYDVEYHGKECIKINEKSYDCIRLSFSKTFDSGTRQFLLYSDDVERKLIRAFLNDKLIEYSDMIC